VSNKAEVRMRRIAKGDQFVIVACDGLWDEMSSCQVLAMLSYVPIYFTYMHIPMYYIYACGGLWDEMSSWRVPHHPS
jgi:hypothetical protein